MAVAAAHNAGIPSVSELLRRADGISVIARERAMETEKARQVSPDLIEKMQQAGLFRIMQPRRYGGFEYGYDVFVEAVRVIRTATVIKNTFTFRDGRI